VLRYGSQRIPFVNCVEDRVLEFGLRIRRLAGKAGKFVEFPGFISGVRLYMETKRNNALRLGPEPMDSFAAFGGCP
jgi:hypothetical protein